MTIELVDGQPTEAVSAELLSQTLLAQRATLGQMGIEEVRDYINSCDEMAMLAFGLRQKATDRMGELKRDHNIPVFQHGVEMKKLAWIESRSEQDDLDSGIIVPFWVRLMDRSRRRQNIIKHKIGSSAVAGRDILPDKGSPASIE